MRRPAAVIAGLMVLLAPFGEGGRDPRALFLLHTLALLFVVLAWAEAPGTGRGGWDIRADPWARVAALLAAGVVLGLASALQASYPLAAALGALDLVVPFALFASAARVGPGDRDLGILRTMVVASTSLQTLLALVRYARGGAGAAAATFLNRNHLAAFLVVGFCLSLASACAPARRPRARAGWIAVAAAHLPGIFLLESRGALGATLVVILVFGSLRFRDLSPRGRMLAIGAFLACALAAASVLGARFSRSPDPYRYSRLAIWRAAGSMIAEKPLWGFGPGMFPHVAERFNFPVEGNPVRYGRTFQGAHSALLTLAAEVGPIAAALILVALVGATVMLLRARPDEQGTVPGIGLAFVALLAQGIVEDLQVRPALTIVPALLAGASAAALRRRAAPASPEPPGIAAAGAARGTLPARIVGAVCALYFFAVAVLLPYLADRDAVAALRRGAAGLPRMERAAALNPLHPDYRNNLAMAILNSGPLTPEGYARASADLLEARRLKPIDYRFPLHLARLETHFAGPLFGDGTAGERAVALYREAVLLAPLDARPRLELAGYLRERKRPAEALQAVQEALELEPNFVRARLLESSILLDLNRRAEAVDSLGLAEATLHALGGYVPDSGYATEIVKDAPGERERLARVLRQDDSPGKRS